MFARAGISDILITNQVCDEVKIEQVEPALLLWDVGYLSVLMPTKQIFTRFLKKQKGKMLKSHCLVELDGGAGALRCVRYWTGGDRVGYCDRDV